MPLSAEQIVAAKGAERLLADPIFTDTLNEIVGDATERAIICPTPEEREANRQLVLAVGRIRATLEAAVEYASAARDDDAKALAHE